MKVDVVEVVLQSLSYRVPVQGVEPWLDMASLCLLSRTKGIVAVHIRPFVPLQHKPIQSSSSSQTPSPGQLDRKDTLYFVMMYVVIAQ